MEQKQNETENPVPEPFGAVKNVTINVMFKIVEL